jgi:hypothetical protein
MTTLATIVSKLAMVGMQGSVAHFAIITVQRIAKIAIRGIFERR